MATVTSVLHLPSSAEDTFQLHADVRNMPRITPPPGARVLHAPTPTRAGDIQVIALGPRWASVRWVAHVVAFDPPRLMVDVQRRGPFRSFRHMHVVLPEEGGSVLVDMVEFRFFPGALGAVLDSLFVAPALRLMFAGRHRRTRALLASGSRDRELGAGASPGVGRSS